MQTRSMRRCCSHSSLRANLIQLTVFVALVSPATAEPLRVELFDGRTAIGEFASKTDGERLWVRNRATGILLESGFAWREIRAVATAGALFTADQFRLQFPQVVGRELRLVENAIPTDSAVHSIATTGPRDALRKITPKIRSLEIDAALARWDPFVAASGLAVEITPITVEGSAAFVTGNLELTVWAEILPSHGDGNQPEFRELARAHHLVRPEDFALGQANYTVEFQQRNPELDPAISPYGLLHARLGVIGQGVFEATDHFVRLRALSPPRDRLEHLRGRRFVPAEAVPRPSEQLRWAR